MPACTRVCPAPSPAPHDHGDAEALWGTGSQSHPPQSTPGCRSGDGHQQAAPASPSAEQRQPRRAMDRSACLQGCASPGTREAQQPSISGGSGVGLAAGRAAGGRDHGPGHRGKGDAAQPPVPFSIPLVQAQLCFPWPGTPCHPRGGGSISRSGRGFLTAAAAPASTGSHGSEVFSPMHGQILAPRCLFATELDSTATSEAPRWGDASQPPSSSRGPGSAPVALCLSIPSPAPFAQPD